MFISCVCIFHWLLLFQIPLDLFIEHLIYRNWRDKAADVNHHEFMQDFQNWSNIACFILKWRGGVCWLKSVWEWFLFWSVCSWKINISWYQNFWICQVFPSGLCRGVGRTYPGKQLLLKKTDHPLFDQILLRTYRQSVRSNSHELFLMLKNAQELIKCTN